MEETNHIQEKFKLVVPVTFGATGSDSRGNIVLKALEQALLDNSSILVQRAVLELLNVHLQISKR
jgi:hypothetical protein